MPGAQRGQQTERSEFRAEMLSRAGQGGLGQFMLKGLEFSTGFQEAIFKARWERGELQGEWSTCTQFFDWLKVRQQGIVTGVNIINPQALVGLGTKCSWSSSS